MNVCYWNMCAKQYKYGSLSYENEELLHIGDCFKILDKSLHNKYRMAPYNENIGIGLDVNFKI